jgi:CubicO group peptidase (beta-lactamase class C family)
MLVRDPVPEPLRHRSPDAPESLSPAGLAASLERIRHRCRVPALAGALIRDGQLVACEAVGIRHVGSAEAVSADDRFHLGSCTKAMTATVCARLVEQHQLRWDTTIDQVFPDLSPALHPDYRGVTLEQLLTHRSGLVEGFSFSTMIWPKIWKLAGPLDAQRRELLRLVLGDPPGHKPGSEYSYSNCGYAIAGALCERVTGQVWEDLIRRLLFEPLDMPSAGFGAPGDAGRDPQPWGHQLSFWTGRWTPMAPGPQSDNPAVIGPAGNVHCSLRDWAKFAALHLGALDGAHAMLSPEMLHWLHSPRFGGDYAFGWTVAERDWAGGRALTHAGSNTLWFAVIWLAPRNKLGLLAATNLGTQMAFSACDAAIGELMDRAG